MERMWLEVGSEYTSGKDRERVTATIEALEWHSPPAEGPLSAVLMLRAVVRESCGCPRSRPSVGVGETPTFSTTPTVPRRPPTPCSGVEANYADGRARLYVLDTGVAAVPLVSDFPAPPPPELDELPEGLFPLGTVVATPGP